MADISAEIAAFKNAVYGEDVRDAMVSLANKLNIMVNPGICVFSSQLPMLSSISASGHSRTVTFDKGLSICFYTDDGKVSYLQTTSLFAGNSFTINNVECLYYDKTNDTVSTGYLTGNVIYDFTKIILITNFYGFLYSPFGNLYDEIIKLTSQESVYQGKTVSAMKSGGGHDMISSIVRNGNSVDLLFKADFVVSCVYNGKAKYKHFNVSSDAYTISNTRILVGNLNTLTLSIQNDNYSISNDEIIICQNLWGRLISPITELNDEIHAIQYGIDGDDYAINDIIVTPDNSFCQIRNVINGINNNNSMNRYRILIKNGTYQEIDIKTKDYVDLIGESKDGVILNCDGKSQETSPSDYFFSDYSSTQISQIPKAYKHLFIHVGNCTISNMTFMSNDVKYIIHQDSYANPYKAIVDTCDLIRTDSYASGDSPYGNSLQHIVGVGAQAQQYQIYKKCNFIKKYIYDGNHKLLSIAPFCSAIFWHNWNNRNNNCGFTLEDCNVIGCNIAYITELGCGAETPVNIINTKTDKPYYGIYYGIQMGYYKIDDVVVTDPTLVPYDITMKITGESPNFVVLDEDRLDGIKQIANAYTMTMVSVSSAVSIGQPVSITRDIESYGSVGLSNDFVIAMESTTNSGGTIYCNSGSVASCLFASGTYSLNDPVYYYNGYFTTSEHGDRVGFIIQDVTLSDDGLVYVYFDR